jgi:hypothetical protein
MCSRMDGCGSRLPTCMQHTYWEGGVRTEAFIWSPLIPATRRGTQYDGMWHVCDWWATYQAIAGATPPANTGPTKPDAVNHWPHILDRSANGGQPARTEVIHMVHSSTYYPGMLAALGKQALQTCPDQSSPVTCRLNCLPDGAARTCKTCRLQLHHPFTFTLTRRRGLQRNIFIGIGIGLFCRELLLQGLLEDTELPRGDPCGRSQAYDLLRGRCASRAYARARWADRRGPLGSVERDLRP